MARSVVDPATTPLTRDEGTELSRALSVVLGTRVAPREFTLPDGTRVGVDFADEGHPTVLAQCAPLRGPVKSVQRNKLIADAFKLVWLRDTHFPDARVVLVMGEQVSRLLARGSWLRAAFATHGLAVTVVDERGTVRPVDTIM
jgi:hypothetical protein